jgi:hypothetical protein
MPRKSRKSKSRKQKVINMIGCSKKHKHSKTCKSKTNLANNACPKCGPNCHCGPNCNCPHPCPGSCYLNRRKVKKGGSGCGSCGCPVGGLTSKQMSQFGGSNLVGSPVLIDGSNTNKYIPIPGISQKGGKMPGPFIGSSWSAPVDKWPTMNGIGGDRNYLANYSKVIGNDPQQQMSMNNSGYVTKNSMVGGYTYKNKRHSRAKSSSSNSIKGGGLIPQDLVNLGSSFTFNLKSAYNSLNGTSAPTNPLPYKDQLQTNNKLII